MVPSSPLWALTTPFQDAVNSLQSTDPALPTGVANPKGSIGYILSTIFGSGSTSPWKIQSQYLDTSGISGASQWTTSGSSIYYGGVVQSTSGGFMFPDGTVQMTAGGGIGAESDPLWTSASGSYYTKTNLQTASQASVNWGNLTGIITANSLLSGILSASDWGIFNAKIGLTSLSATSPLSYNNSTGVFGIGQATTSTNGYLSSVDWNAFNGKQTNIATGTTAQYYRGDKTWVTLDKTAVGLANVDNTSDATKNSTVATLTNKTIDTAGSNVLKVNGNSLSASVGTATLTLPNSTDTLVGRATTDALTNKSVNGVTLSTLAGASNYLAGDGTYKAANLGSVTNISITTANGFTGVVTNPTTTPTITLFTSITGMIKGSAGALVSAIAGTDYLVPSAVSGTTGYLSKFTGTNTVGNSLIYDNGTNV